jgi:hypothetical protein
LPGVKVWRETVIAGGREKYQPLKSRMPETVKIISKRKLLDTMFSCFH